MIGQLMAGEHEVAVLVAGVMNSLYADVCLISFESIGSKGDWSLHENRGYNTRYRINFEQLHPL